MCCKTMARRRGSSTRRWLLGVAALVVAVLVAMSGADAAKRRDPYEVLGVAKTASDREVRPRPPHLALWGLQVARGVGYSWAPSQPSQGPQGGPRGPPG